VKPEQVPCQEWICIGFDDLAEQAGNARGKKC